LITWQWETIECGGSIVGAALGGRKPGPPGEKTE